MNIKNMMFAFYRRKEEEKDEIVLFIIQRR